MFETAQISITKRTPLRTKVDVPAHVFQCSYPEPAYHFFKWSQDSYKKILELLHVAFKSLQGFCARVPFTVFPLNKNAIFFSVHITFREDNIFMIQKHNRQDNIFMIQNHNYHQVFHVINITCKQNNSWS